MFMFTCLMWTFKFATFFPHSPHSTICVCFRVLWRSMEYRDLNLTTGFPTSIYLFVSNIHHNGWTDRAKFCYGTLRDPREGLWHIKIGKSIPGTKFDIFFENAPIRKENPLQFVNNFKWWLSEQQLKVK